jgi:CRP-like cAMP-binding protein
MNSFGQFMSKYAPITKDEVSLINSHAEEITLKKNEFLQESGQQTQGVYFLNNGAMRSFFLNDGKNVTWKFYFPGDLPTDYFSFLHQEPTKLSFIALTPTKVQLLTKTAISKLIKKVEKGKELENFFSRFAYLDVRQRAEQLLLLNPEQRYEELVSRNPELVRELPAQHIATYLGIQPPSYSRLKRRYFTKKKKK